MEENTMKKILSLVCILSIMLTSMVGITVAKAANAPVIDSTTEYTTISGVNYLKLSVLISGFEYESQDNPFTGEADVTKALIAAQGEVSYDTSALTYFMGTKGDIQGVITGKTSPTFAAGVALANGMNASSNLKIATFFFKINDGVDFTKQQVEFGFVNGTIRLEFADASVTDNVVYGDHAEAKESATINKSYYGTKAPVVTEYSITAEDATVSADKATEGTEITVEPKAKDGYKITKVAYNGTEITAVDGVYKFTMPAENVTVTVEYEELPKVFTPVFEKTTEKYTNKDVEVPAYNCTLENVDLSKSVFFNFKASDREDVTPFEADFKEYSGAPKMEFMVMMFGVPNGITVELKSITQ